MCGSSGQALACKYKALSSNPSPIKEKKKKVFQKKCGLVYILED
jgi:hypothetical protein